MTKIVAHNLRLKLDNKLIKLIAPKGMSLEEYKISCHLEGFEPSVENGIFLHWVMTADGDDSTIVEKVEKLIISALNDKYLLDVDDASQCEYFCDAIHDLLLRDKDYIKQLLDATLTNYKNSSKYGLEVFEYCRRLNKAFGFTITEYFHDGNLASALKKALK